MGLRCRADLEDKPRESARASLHSLHSLPEKGGKEKGSQGGN